ncbi:MAG: YafY family transcriptional regulator [Anaerolineae bacterium]|nr:YafY family transcriptional regulator [Anaerolineae bacterium]
MRADRLISLLMLLQTHGRLTAEELAERLECSPRTIYRDLDALSASGVPVYAERGPQGGCMLMESYRTNLTGLKEDEVRALFMFTVPGLLADLGADKAGESALLKLTASLPAPFQQDAQRVQERLYLDPAAWFQQEEPTPFLPLVQTAVFTDRRLRIQYRRADGQWVKRLVDPLGLVAKAGIWYLVGITNFPHPQTYRVSRIQEAEMSEGHGRRPPQFQLADYWQQWCAQFEARRERYTVTARVAPEAISHMLRFFGESLYALLEQPGITDEQGYATLSLPFDSAQAACEALMGLGTAVEILSPPELREQIRVTAVQLAALYARHGGQFDQIALHPPP